MFRPLDWPHRPLDWPAGRLHPRGLLAAFRWTDSRPTIRHTIFFLLDLLTVVYSTQVALIPRPASEPGLLWAALAWQAIY